LCMDKAAAKAVFRAEGLSTPAYVLIRRREWERDKSQMVARVADEIGYPCFVKPVNLGSSVGVTKVHDESELPRALDIAAMYDRRLLVEKAINAREIECSVLGNDYPIVSVPGEIVPKREFYDYEAKYLDDNTELIVPAQLPEGKVDEIRSLAGRAFTAVDCAGMARADFFLCRDTGMVYINELNTIPGFTSVSMYPRLWEASGMSFPELVHRLVQLALERHDDQTRRSTAKSPEEA
jgi:D-alanine-D-alanine ligase